MRLGRGTIPPWSNVGLSALLKSAFTGAGTSDILGPSRVPEARGLRLPLRLSHLLLHVPLPLALPLRCVGTQDGHLVQQEELLAQAVRQVLVQLAAKAGSGVRDTGISAEAFNRNRAADPNVCAPVKILPSPTRLGLSETDRLLINTNEQPLNCFSAQEREMDFRKLQLNKAIPMLLTEKCNLIVISILKFTTASTGW